MTNSRWSGRPTDAIQAAGLGRSLKGATNVAGFKFEIRNKFQIQNTNARNGVPPIRAVSHVLVIWISSIRICFGFRISCFGFPKRLTPETVGPCQFPPAELVDESYLALCPLSGNRYRPRALASNGFCLLNSGHKYNRVIWPEIRERQISQAAPFAFDCPVDRRFL